MEQRDEESHSGEYSRIIDLEMWNGRQTPVCFANPDFSNQFNRVANPPLVKTKEWFIFPDFLGITPAVVDCGAFSRPPSSRREDTGPSHWPGHCP